MRIRIQHPDAAVRAQATSLLQDAFPGADVGAATQAGGLRDAGERPDLMLCAPAEAARAAPQPAVVLIARPDEEEAARRAVLEGAADEVVFLAAGLGALPSVCRLALARAAARAAAPSDAQRLAVIDLSADAILVQVGAEVRHANPAALRLLGARAATVLGRPLVERFHPDDRERARALHAELPRAIPYEDLCVVRDDGQPVQVEVTALPFTLGGAPGSLTVLRDATRRARAEDAVRMYEDVVAGMQLGVYVYALEEPGDPASLRLVATNEAAEAFTGVPGRSILGKRIGEAWPGLMRTQLPARYAEVIESGVGRDLGEVAYRDGTVDGTFTVRVFPLPGRCVCIAFQNVTERKRIERALQTSEERFRRIARAASDALWDWDLITGQVWWSESYGLLSRGREGSAVLPSSEWVERLHPDDRERVVAGLDRLFAGDGSAWTEEYRFRLDSGEYALIQDKGEVARDEAGRAVRMMGAMRDITRERALQEQLQQSRKLDAVGRLAGGIAHDFNNLLTAILGYSELALDRIGEQDPLRQDLEQIREAGERAAALTRQLLAFGRQQPVVPRRIDLDEVLAGLAALLRRMIPEGIRLTTRVEPGTPPAKGDQGQLEQVLINLVLNARDAMPAGGRLEVLAAPDPAGEDGAPRVRLDVVDEGIGMSEDVRRRVFEPFFTTKPGGTGLGLPSAYGLVQQMGGAIAIQSAPGRGTRFRVTLPAWRGETEPETPRALVEPSGRGERVLLVEDEEPVRALAHEVLRRAGYRVHPAARAEEALRILREAGEGFELLLTDVVMPGESGPALAEAVRARSPRTRVLLMSAHGDPGPTPSPGRPLVRKPFAADTLLRAVRAVLDAPADG